MNDSSLFRLIVIFLFMFATQTVSAATISSDFSVDAEGWIGIPGEGSVSHVAAGGNPGGHIRVTDVGVGGPLGSGAIAPAKFLGNLLTFDNGTLSTDMATFAGGGSTFAIFGTVRITSTSDEAFFDLAAVAPAPAGTWQSYSAPLTAAAWGKSSLEWMALLSDVIEIAISTDAFDGADTIGIDNFTIASVDPVPVPAAVWLFGSALIGLFGFSKRRKVA